MIKRFPSGRNQRSKGVKIKHVLQVILLLGVCFWLIYQVKHNHDKKKDFDKNDSTLSSVRTETDKVVKHGRKDLKPVKDEVDHSGKLEEEEDEPIVEVAEEKPKEEGNKHETEESEDSEHEGREEQDEEENKHGTDEGREEQDEEENKHGTKEQEEGENKTEEIEDEGGDVEVDENDHEKSDVDNDQDDDDADELKDKVEDSDETENEEKEDEEKGSSVENDENHEAREEHYKGDDASSAVAHDTQTTSTETEPINLTQAGLSVQMNIEQPDNATTYHSDENNMNQNDSELKDREVEVADVISSNVTAGKETGNNSSSTETAETNTVSHLDVGSNLTAVITESSNNSTGAGDDTANSSEQIKTVIVSESDNAQNATANTTVAGDIKQTEGLEQTGNKTSEGDLPDNAATVSVKPDNGDAALQESPTLGDSALEKTMDSLASNETETIFGNSNNNATSDTIESDKSTGITETSEANKTQNIDASVDEKSDSSSANEILDAVIHDAIDSSDTQNTHEDMATARTDLDTLPDIQNEGNEGDENSAE
ncbi:uncharacterized protein LOC131643418 [Vicia villosa]|uniref:uncharacterized protein LOC131643418 n=1 Tax=Vicia villosa TaxID=3911 RepID=UPI00273BE82F|nr:uncharacterized protein LOC131643418 [Vicia villosa]XP_058769615.1 uncharacterized protein LOC131643418 [Vicia villosa]